MFKAIRIPAVAVIALALPQLALAHALLVSSSPQANQSISAGPLHVDLKFDSRVDGSRSVVTLSTPSGNDHTLQSSGQPSPNEITADTDSLKPGSYTLRWQALSSDGHITRGEIPFRVE